MSYGWCFLTDVNMSRVWSLDLLELPCQVEKFQAVGADTTCAHRHRVQDT